MRPLPFLLAHCIANSTRLSQGLTQVDGSPASTTPITASRSSRRQSSKNLAQRRKGRKREIVPKGRENRRVDLSLRLWDNQTQLPSRLMTRRARAMRTIHFPAALLLAGVYKLFASKGHMAWAHQGLRGGLAYDLRERFYW